MSWLTRFLGFDEIIVAKDGEIVNLYTQIHRKDELLKELLETKDDQLAIKDAEIQRLTDLMLTEHGVILRENEARATTTEKPQPIGRRPAWSNVKKRFEDADAKIARQLAKDQVDQMSKYWEDKNSKAESEGVA